MGCRLGVSMSLLLVAMLCAFAPSAGARGLILRGESLRLGAIAPSVVLPDGRLIDVRRLVVGRALPPYDDGDLLVHDLDSGRTEVADGDLAIRPLVSIEGAGSAQIGSLLAAPGAVVVYESLDRGRTSLAGAERFTQFDPPNGGGVYLSDPAAPVPEPASSAALAIGVLGLFAAARSAHRRAAADRPGR